MTNHSITSKFFNPNGLGWRGVEYRTVRNRSPWGANTSKFVLAFNRFNRGVFLAKR